MFQDSNIRVAKKIERPFGYGIALEGDVKRLEDDIRDYVMVNERKILNTIEENVKTGTLKVSWTRVFMKSSHCAHTKNGVVILGNVTHGFYH